MQPSDIVDRARYPIADLASPAAQALIERGRKALAQDGLALLPGFVCEDAVAAMAAEAEALIPLAYRRDEWNGIYSYDPEADAGAEALPADHPRRRRHRSRMGVIAYDLLPAHSPTRRLYEWPALTRFVAALTGETALYTCADPLASCVITVLERGDSHAWHYDENDFVVSLLLQAADIGGMFEYAPEIRTDSDENYDGVRRLLDGAPDLLRRAELGAGCLALFRGRRSLHHVTTVEGTRPRLIALFSYDRKPGMVFSAEVHRRALGRSR